MKLLGITLQNSPKFHFVPTECEDILIDGIKVRQFHIALVGALLVTVLALILDGLLALAVWASVPGSGRLRPGRLPQPLLDDEVSLESRRLESSKGRTARPG